MNLSLSRLKIINALIFLFCYTNLLQAQDIIPPSPEASALLKYANTPVDLYTGTPKVDLPLVELKGRKISIPVSLSYHASGIKVQDIASSVGLGWTLNAGGVITRIVRGIPDEKPEGYCGTNQRGKEVVQEDILQYTHQYLHQIGSNNWDGEPDIFYFNVQGITGRFVIDADGNPVLFPYQNIKIKPGIGPLEEDGSWEMTMEDGTVYIFGLDNNSREESEYTTKKLDDTQKTESYISSWYLSKIKTPNNEESFNFNYQIGDDISYSFYRKVELKEISEEGDCDRARKTELKDLTTDITIKSPKYLKQIKTSTGNIDFSYEISRTDIRGGLALSSIELKNNIGSIVKNINLKYDYFRKDGSYRLRLDKVIDNTAFGGPTLYAFNYYTNHLLPARDSPNYDHWGYYNNNSVDSHIPRVDNNNGTYYDGASREPYAAKMQANILTKITYATGGYTEYVYEAHNYIDDQGEEKLAGGVRIKTIRQHDNVGGSVDVVKTYVYNSSGLIYGIPLYRSDFDRLENGSRCVYDVLVRYSQSLNELFDIGGKHVGYTTVSENNSDGSTTISSFTNFDTYPDEETSVYQRYYYMYAIQGFDPFGNPTSTPFPVNFEGNWGTNISPYPASTYKGWKRGQLKEVIYKNHEGNNVKREIYNYEFNTDIKKSVKGLVVEERFYFTGLDQDTPNHWFYYGQYEIISQPYFLDYIIEEQYDQGNETKKIITRTDYQYDPEFLQVKQVKTTDSEGTEWITKYSYITDFYDVLKESLNDAENYADWHPDNSKETRALLGLLASHQHTQILEQTTSKKLSTDVEKVIGSKLMLYKWSGTEPLRAQVSQALNLPLNQPIPNFSKLSVTKTGENLYTLSYDDRYQITQTWNKHDEHSNVLQQTSRDDIRTSYLWSYENSIPIAQAINASHAQIAYTSFENPETKLFSQYASEGNFTWEDKEEWYNLISKTGQKSFSGELKREALPPGNYTLSLWAKKKHNSASSEISVTDNTAKNAGIDWTYLEWSFTLNSATDITIQSNGNYIDEVRIYPATAQMTTYTYDPLIGITSQTDMNNITTYYEYDAFHRLKTVKDQNQDIRKRYKYQYKTASSGQ